ncbi:MAG: DUF1080 domain-containing protein [Pirellulales bacterium]|nr:DUF1080 domain-containing protein [Pirellulales bacterium]
MCKIQIATAILAWGLGYCGMVLAADFFTDAKEAGDDYAYQGEYTGKVAQNGKTVELGLQVIAGGNGKFTAVLYTGGLPGAGWTRESEPGEKLSGTVEKGALQLTGKLSRVEVAPGGTAAKLTIPDQPQPISLAKVDRASPTLGAKPPEGAIVLYGGKDDKKHWQGGSVTEDGLLASHPGGNLVCDQELGDFTLHLEFRTPFMPTASGQGRGNSGVYLQNRYELQVLDSFGLSGENNECGGFYQVAQPLVNMCLPPLVWQTYDIDFTGAKFDAAGKKTANAKVTVKHNGVVIHDNVEFKNVTPGGVGQEAPGRGPLMMQDHGNPVAYRNIWVIKK